VVGKAKLCYACFKKRRAEARRARYASDPVIRQKQAEANKRRIGRMTEEERKEYFRTTRQASARRVGEKAYALWLASGWGKIVVIRGEPKLVEDV